ncbi:cell surface protein [Chitinophaga eiseniae]|uniref:Cell surface protein n=1 Tax=Chitinophaga eiseniae TaxID=634771 RepID=A0A847SPC2_9BACT|nr:cell surface protein [Chitinophaga eiseniae]NLR79718.1 cell surface protein [Chitinophaga eiseniae]
MKRKHLLFALTAALAAGSCSKDKNDVQAPGSQIVITTADVVPATQLKWVKITPQVDKADNASYLWTMGKDTLAVTKDLMYAFDTTGNISLKFSVKTATDSSQKNIVVQLAAPAAPYTNAVTKVFEYFPAPGQFINTLPEWKAGQTDKDMADAALAKLNKENMISLGGFGGYVIMGFDHTIVNKPGKSSFLVLGNAFANNAEPGVIMVAADANGNGLPDDPWYEIAGSEYNNPKTIKNYQITYYKPDENKTPVTDPNDPYSSDVQYIRWEDNQGKSGYLVKNPYHTQSYYPQWKGNSIVFTGTRLPDDQIRNTSSNPASPYWVLPAFPYGYVDNQANTDVNAQIKLDWAVDNTGKPVKLSGIDFIRVHSGIRKEAGWLGEVSTEVAGVRDLNLK